ncbi:MAG TPA: sigma-54 dependent transcriptional regulator [Terriglobia bacterium]|nr:sigma-54 dependent transcriptional regulator [Terriglobia bacterium]
MVDRASVVLPAAGSSGTLPPHEVLFGRSKAMANIRRRFRQVAEVNIPVLIEGETGSGKELLARAIHENSPWAEGPFVKVNCPAIPGTLLESELFGYEKGAFTGAYGTKPGRVESANRGTLFLDEISELDPLVQPKFLQLLQDGQFCRIGAQEDRQIEARVICATNRDLRTAVEQRSFRQDLYYRINVLNLRVPPLRERREDIPALVDYLIKKHDTLMATPTPPPSTEFVQLLQNYEWPGNVRQLENLIKRYIVLKSEIVITSELVAQICDSPEFPLSPHDSRSLKEITRSAMKEVERRVILKTLVAHRWNRIQAAKALKISYRALLYKMQQTGLTIEFKTRQEGVLPLKHKPFLAEGDTIKRG